ncbi:MAG: hypothetical protein ABSC46_13920 [Candidatus Limnocylindrales bacterium]|jgi:hypothetical protein
MTGIQIRRTSAAVAIVAVLVLITAGVALIPPSSQPATTDTGAPGVDTGCDHWCGNGSAVVSIGGVTTTITGGGCYDQGSDGYDIRFGDWQGLQGVSSYLALTAYRAGGPTPTPAITTNPLAAPSATDHATPLVSGSVGGSPFVLGDDTVITFNTDGTGSFSGTDLNGAGLIKGTYRCS